MIEKSAVLAALQLAIDAVNNLPAGVDLQPQLDEANAKAVSLQEQVDALSAQLAKVKDLAAQIQAV